MIEELRRNIDAEIEMLREISSYYSKLEGASEEEKKVLNEAIESLRNSLKTVNDSIPKIAANITLAKSLKGEARYTGLESISVKNKGGVVGVTLPKEERARFLRELQINENLMKKLKKPAREKEEAFGEFKKSRGYVRISNKYFLENAKNLIKKGYFKPLADDLKRGNFDILFETYVAMTLLSLLVSFFVSLILAIFLIFFKIGLDWPFITLYTGGYLMRILYVAWIPIVVPVLAFFGFYYYPSTEKSSIARKIDQELPFAAIHMSSISGSGIEPSGIFKIIALEKEYPYLRIEVRKVLNQINIYGYDLVTALNNVSKSTPSTKLGDLFSGVASTITSGGNLSDFFEKRAETLLLGYRLDRERFTKLAETFMDIYISVVIATPMILMLLLVILSISAPGVGLSPNLLTFIIVMAVVVVNAFFLIFLHLKQPSY